MKNETNTQHTPELSIAILWPYLFCGTKAKDVTLMVVDDAEAHAKEADEKTAGNAFFKYVPLSLALRSSELLKENKQLLLDIELQKFERERVSKENEQLKKEVDRAWRSKDKYEALNAELLEALKNQVAVIRSFAGIEAWIPDRELKEKWQAKIYPSITDSESAIAKAEAKNLPVS